MPTNRNRFAPPPLWWNVFLAMQMPVGVFLMAWRIGDLPRCNLFWRCEWWLIRRYNDARERAALAMYPGRKKRQNSP